MRRPRPPHVVAAAWIVTGPLGHLYAGVLDWAQVLAHFARARVRARARARARARVRGERL